MAPGPAEEKLAMLKGSGGAQSVVGNRVKTLANQGKRQGNPRETKGTPWQTLGTATC